MHIPVTGGRPRSRRDILFFGAALGSTALLSACGGDTTGPTATSTAGTAGTAAGAFPVTIRDTFGTVTIPKAPSRILSLGRTDHDVLLALGIVPIGVFQFTEEMKRGVGVWAESKLGTVTPEFFSPPFDYEQVGRLHPDLILDVQSRGDKDEYKSLTAFAPTVGLPPDRDPNSVPWQQSTDVISTAVGRKTDGAALVSRTEALLKKAAADNPTFAGRTVTILLAWEGEVAVYSSADTRTQVVTALGLTPSKYVTSLGTEEAFVSLSAERMADADADVVIVLSQQGLPKEKTLAEYPQIARMAAVTENRAVFPDNNTGLALSFASVLSIPYAIKALVPQIGDALR